jgi:hypothetical protein
MRRKAIRVGTAHGRSPDMGEGQRERSESGAGRRGFAGPSGSAPGSPRRTRSRQVAAIAAATVAVCAAAAGVSAAIPEHSSDSSSTSSMYINIAVAGQVEHPGGAPSPTGTIDALPSTVAPVVSSVAAGQQPIAPVHSAAPPAQQQRSSGSTGKTAAPPPAAPPAATTPASTVVEVSGQVSCTSGNSVEGVWVSALSGSGYSPWKGLGNGSTSDYWYNLPTSESYSLHVGCGGTQANWGVADYGPVVSGTHNSFNCIDVAGASGYGTCVVRD